MNSWVQSRVNQFSACNNFNHDLYEQINHEGVEILCTIWNDILIVDIFAKLEKNCFLRIDTK